MASISNDPGGRRRILFVDPAGERRTIRLGKASQRSAESYKGRVEQLLEAQILNRPMDSDLAEWVAGLHPRIAKKFAKVGLIAKPEEKAATTLGAFLSDFTTRRIDVKPATKEVWSQVVRNLLEHFGGDRNLADVCEADAEDFKMFLVGEKLAPTTIHKRLQFARMFFRAAKKRKLVKENPFAEVTAKAVLRQDRQYFITRDETDKLLAACPNQNWRLIVALARYGGLRCPSEVLSLRWEDVDWTAGKITVQSPKTEHHPGKGTRSIPLFPEIRAELEAAFNPEATYVVEERMRASAQGKAGWRNCNLRTQFERIVKRAGLKAWPRLFHAMRASRETELAKDYPIHVVTTWLGNTPRIALKHYLQVTDADFERAAGMDQDAKAGGAECGAQAARNAAQQTRAGKSGELHELSATLTKCATSAIPSDTQLLSAKGLNGEDRIRTCGTVSRTPV